MLELKKKGIFMKMLSVQITLALVVLSGCSSRGTMILPDERGGSIPPYVLTGGIGTGSTITKSIWKGNLLDAVPTVACSPIQKFRQCYDVSPKECVNFFAQSTADCIKKYDFEVGGILGVPQQKDYWDSVISRCAANSYMLNFSDRVHDNYACRKLSSVKKHNK